MADLKAVMEKLYASMESPGTDIDASIDTYFAEDFVEHESPSGDG